MRQFALRLREIETYQAFDINGDGGLVRHETAMAVLNLTRHRVVA